MRSRINSRGGCAASRIENRTGQLGGVVAMSIVKIRTFLMALILLGMMLTIASARAQSERESSADVPSPVEPPTPDINETRLFTELLTHNELRNAALLG